MKKVLICQTQKNKVLKKQLLVLNTISGGQDSIVNFFLFLHKSGQMNIENLYCQHFWQTKNFFSSRLIFKISFLFEIPYTIILPKGLLVTENLSRDWRKNQFYRLLQLEKTRSLVTGHTLTDVLEKNFYNLLRGTSSKGLSESDFLNYEKKSIIFFPNLIFNLISPSRFFGKKNSKKVTKTFFCQKQNSPLKQKKRKNQKSTLIFYFFFLNKKKKKEETQKKPAFISDKKIFIPSIDKQSLGTKTSFLRQSLFSSKSCTKNCVFVSDLEKETSLVSADNKKNSRSFCFYSNPLKQKMKTLRPLLNLRRFQIYKIIYFYKYPLLQDITNFSTNFSRNKIRHQLFPYIRFRFNKNFEILIRNFFRTLSYEYQEKKKEILEIRYLCQTTKIFYFERDLGIEHSLVQKIFSNYRDIDLNYQQNSILHTLLFLEKRQNQINGLPGTRTRN
jgi:tRNA(Ile)-lysidine synthase TilS/MesJ